MDIKANIIGFLAVFKYSTKKILFSKKIIIAILIALFIAGIMAYAGSEINSLENTGSDSYLDAGTELFDVLILFFFLPVVAMVYGASVINDEIEDKSITQLVVSPLDRAFTYLAYYLSLIVSLSIVMLAIVLIAFLAFFGQTGINSDSIEILGSMCGLVLIGSLAYSAFFLFISVLFDKPLMIGLFYAFIWEGFIGSIPGKIGTVAMKHYIRSIGSHWIEHGDIAVYANAWSVGDSAAVLVGVILACLFMGIVLLREKEFP